MKIFSLFLFCITAVSIYSQESFVYNCTRLSNKTLKIKVVNGNKPLSYQDEKVYITKYSIEYNKKLLVDFFAYKYKNKLFLIDGKTLKLNHTKDQVVFSIPKKSMYNINLSGILANTQLYLKSFVSMNDKTFYTYMLDSGNLPISISEIIFDEELFMDEIRFKSNNSTCKCTKSNIVIELK